MELEKLSFKKMLGLVAFAILLYWGLHNLSFLWKVIQLILGLAAPFLLGTGIAFILNVPMRWIERILFKPSPGKSGTRSARLQAARRPISLLLSIVFVLGVVVIVMFMIVPEIGRSVDTIRASLPAFMNRMNALAVELQAYIPALAEGLDMLQLDWPGILSTVMNFVQAGASSLLGSAFNIAASVFSGVFAFFLGMVFAIYILLQKEQLTAQAKKILYAYMPESGADECVTVGRLANKTFSNFLSGQCIEAVILGVMFFIAMSLFRFPFALMVSVLIAFTALIPIFGAFIGCGVGVFMLLVSAPDRVLWFLVLFLVLQQVEGNLIYPKVVGGSVGLPSMWVLAAVTIGGSTMGVMGMLLFIPLSSVFYALLRRNVYDRVRARGIAANKLCAGPPPDPSQSHKGETQP